MATYITVYFLSPVSDAEFNAKQYVSVINGQDFYVEWLQS